MFALKLKKNLTNYHPPEVVGRGSETKLQVGENLNYLVSECFYVALKVL